MLIAIFDVARMQWLAHHQLGNKITRSFPDSLGQKILAFPLLLGMYILMNIQRDEVFRRLLFKNTGQPLIGEFRNNSCRVAGSYLCTYQNHVLGSSSTGTEPSYGEIHPGIL